MTKQQAILDVIADIEARDVVNVAIEEAEALRNQAVRELFAAIRRSVAFPDDRLAQQAARRALGHHARVLNDYLRLRAASALTAANARETCRQHGLDFDAVEAEAERRRYQVSKRAPQHEAESGSGGYAEASPAAPTSPASGPGRRVLVEA